MVYNYILDTIYGFIDYYTKFKVVILNKDAKKPIKADYGCAGYDVFSSEHVVVKQGERKLVPIGIKCEIPRNYYLRVAPRSGLSLIGIDIGAGVIDSSYRGELKVLVINNGIEDFYITPGNKIAQLILERCSNTVIEITDSLSESERGYGGFGSTGK
jgi:dUTP pyrophosphatase